MKDMKGDSSIDKVEDETSGISQGNIGKAKLELEKPTDEVRTIRVPKLSERANRLRNTRFEKTKKRDWKAIVYGMEKSTNEERDRMQEDEVTLEDSVKLAIKQLTDLTKDMHDYKLVLDDAKIKKLIPPEGTERDLFNLGLILLESGSYGDAELAQEFLKTDFPINFQHPISGKTLLHVAASCNAGALANALLDSNKCDLLARDKGGHLAYDLSYRFSKYNGDNHRDCNTDSINDRMLKQTLKQAEAKQVEVDFKYGHSTHPKFEID